MTQFTARVMAAEFGVPRAMVQYRDHDGKYHSHWVSLREWTAPNGDTYHVVGDTGISNPDYRHAVNLALLEFQEYESSFENPGYAE